MEPLLAVLLATSAGAAAAALAGLLFVGGRTPSRRPLGWANALAAGLMFGAAYALLAEGLELGVFAATAGALVGVALVHVSHRLGHTAELDLNLVDEPASGYGARVWGVQSVHSAWEGVAIGAAAAMSLELGLILVAILALHNVAEATLLIAVLRGRGIGLPRASMGAVSSNLPQVAMGLLVFGLARGADGAWAFAAGVGVGAIVQLVLVELLPEAYRQAGPASIALVTSVAVGLTVLLTETVV
jgi:ZIP family zinc transporter